MQERDGWADKAEEPMASYLMLGKEDGEFCSLHMGLGICVQTNVQVSSIRGSQYNATVGLILVTSLPCVRSVMQKKRNVTWLAACGDRNSENGNKRSAAM